MSCCDNINEAVSLNGEGCDCGCGDSRNEVRPILCREQYQQSYRECCENGCCCKYPCSARNTFWPEFSHPRCLSCAELYNNGDAGCCND